MALVELDIAREIVIIGFSLMIIALAVLPVIIEPVGGKDRTKKILTSLDEKRAGIGVG
jgi:hypothetical protein